jgi:hypothetical protein
MEAAAFGVKSLFEAPERRSCQPSGQNSGKISALSSLDQKILRDFDKDHQMPNPKIAAC